MSFSDIETSQFEATPVELHKFTGNGRVYGYTNHYEDFTFDGTVYKSVAMDRGNIGSRSAAQDLPKLTVKLPIGEELCNDYGRGFPPFGLTYILYQGHLQDFTELSDGIVFWNGVVDDLHIADKEVTFNVYSKLGKSLNTGFPTITASSVCAHVLGDSRCKVNLDLFKVETTIADIAGNIITLTSINTKPDNWATAGEAILTDGQRRLIISQTGTTVKLSYGFRNASVGDNIRINAGCNHIAAGDCKNKFNNLINNLSFINIPKINPYTNMNGITGGE